MKICRPHRSSSQRFSSIVARRGFTLIEVMAALIIFGIATVAIVEGMSAAIAIQANLAEEQRAAMLGENVLEEIQYTGTLDEGEDGGQYTDADAAYSWHTSIVSTPTTGLYQVTATVSWGVGANPHIYTLTTFVQSGSSGSPLGGNQGTPKNGASGGSNSRGSGGGAAGRGGA